MTLMSARSTALITRVILGSEGAETKIGLSFQSCKQTLVSSSLSSVRNKMDH
jgi:hypothetical protein